MPPREFGSSGPRHRLYSRLYIPIVAYLSMRLHFPPVSKRAHHGVAGFIDGVCPHKARRILSVIPGNQKERVLVSAVEDKTAAVRHHLERPDVDYIEVRDQTAGCFDFRIERVGEKVFQC
jgi:hypothetical protein